MGSMWIFLLFVGIAALLKGKEVVAEQKSAPQEAPTNEEREEIERRIREIMGMPQVEKRGVPPVASPVGQTLRTPTTMQPSQPQRSTRLVSQPSAGSVSNKRKTNVVAPKANPISTKTQVPQSITAPAKTEAVMDDFSLEKAVIYAEILQPKFKEY